MFSKAIWRSFNFPQKDLAPFQCCPNIVQKDLAVFELFKLHHIITSNMFDIIALEKGPICTSNELSRLVIAECEPGRIKGTKRLSVLMSTLN